MSSQEPRLPGVRRVINAHESGSHFIKCWFFIMFETVDSADIDPTTSYVMTYSFPPTGGMNTTHGD
jgi:hypothetical protein